jgi:D-3-phosphoglycerate dehydrogenase
VLVSEEVATQLLDVLDGRSARYAVNAPLLTPETAQAVAPYLGLAEILGRFISQFSRTGIRRLTLEIGGELARDLAGQDAAPLTAAMLRGVLEDSTTERVNLVNAAALAKARGIAIVERKSPDAEAWSSLLSLTAEGDGATTTIAGTVANDEPRLTRLGEHRTDMAFSPVMLVTRHHDRPGTMGRIGSMLGTADVNISAMHLARSEPRADALMILALDDDVPAGVARAIRAEDAVLDLWLIHLSTDH